jgi:hypothetical protein
MGLNKVLHAGSNNCRLLFRSTAAAITLAGYGLGRSIMGIQIQQYIQHTVHPVHLAREGNHHDARFERCEYKPRRSTRREVSPSSLLVDAALAAAPARS